MIVELLKKLTILFTSKRGQDAYAYWLYVQCDRCGEKIRSRVDLRNDLSIRYGDSERDAAYFCHKTVVGSGRCFQKIEVDLTFGGHRQLVDWQIRGGKFIGEEAFFD